MGLFLCRKLGAAKLSFGGYRGVFLQGRRESCAPVARAGLPSILDRIARRRGGCSSRIQSRNSLAQHIRPRRFGQACGSARGRLRPGHKGCGSAPRAYTAIGPTQS